MALRLAEDVMATVAKALQVLVRHAAVAPVYVFGSHVEGTPDDYSDIDLAVFVEGAEHWHIGQRARTSLLVQREAGHHLELHFFPATALEHAEPASFAAYVKEHGVRVPLQTGP